MPKMDAGPTDGPSGETLAAVWVTLTEHEANELLAALQEWSSEPHDADGGWHTHITDTDGNELAVGIE